MKKFPLAISKFPLAIIAIAIISTLLFTACRKDEYETRHMTFVTNYSPVQFYLNGNGEATIDWGDGTPSETYTFAKENLSPQRFTHSYSSSPPHVITITGENITILLCDGYRLTNLDVSRNTALTDLTCYDNQLTSLDVSKNPVLRLLDCGYNQLTHLDLSRNTALIALFCYGNQLTNLDVSRNTALTHLICGYNQLTNLDVSRNTALTYLNCYNIQLTHLDVSRNTALKTLYCDNNQLTNLDVSKNTALTYLNCRNNQLQADALNTLFHSLPVFSLGIILIAGNPGTDACDKSIATAKGWTVWDY